MLKLKLNMAVLTFVICSVLAPKYSSAQDNLTVSLLGQELEKSTLYILDVDNLVKKFSGLPDGEEIVSEMNFENSTLTISFQGNPLESLPPIQINNLTDVLDTTFLGAEIVQKNTGFEIKLHFNPHPVAINLGSYENLILMNVYTQKPLTFADINPEEIAFSDNADTIEPPACAIDENSKTKVYSGWNACKYLWNKYASLNLRVRAEVFNASAGMAIATAITLWASEFETDEDFPQKTYAYTRERVAHITDTYSIPIYESLSNKTGEVREELSSRSESIFGTASIPGYLLYTTGETLVVGTIDCIKDAPGLVKHFGICAYNTGDNLLNGNYGLALDSFSDTAIAGGSIYLTVAGGKALIRGGTPIIKHGVNATTQALKNAARNSMPPPPSLAYSVVGVRTRTMASTAGRDAVAVSASNVGDATTGSFMMAAEGSGGARIPPKRLSIRETVEREIKEAQAELSAETQTASDLTELIAQKERGLAKIIETHGNNSKQANILRQTLATERSNLRIVESNVNRLTFRLSELSRELQLQNFHDDLFATNEVYRTKYMELKNNFSTSAHRSRVNLQEMDINAHFDAVRMAIEYLEWHPHLMRLERLNYFNNYLLNAHPDYRRLFLQLYAKIRFAPGHKPNLKVISGEFVDIDALNQAAFEASELLLK